MSTVDTLPRLGTLVYRFQGQLAEMYPIGLFPSGIRFHNNFEGTITDGPFNGAAIFGLDQFTVRPDGVGVIVAHEVIDAGTTRVAVDLRGYVVPPDGAPEIPLEAMLDPTFEFPDAPFRVTGAATAQTTDPAWAHLNRAVIVVEGSVNLATGELDVEARVVEI